MRVTHIVLSLNVGGLERGVLNQLREGRKLGQAVSVICLEEPGELAAQAQREGATVACLNKPPGIGVRTFSRMSRALRELSPDVVHSHHIATLFYAGPVAHWMRVPLVVHTEHGRKNYAGRLRTRMLGRIAALFTRTFYCLTEDMASAVEQCGIAPAGKVQVIFNGIDTSFYAKPWDASAVRRRLGISDTAPVVGTVGRLNEIKRQDVLLRAFARVVHAVPEAHLIVVGDGPLRSQLHALASELGIAGNTHFVGYQSETPAFVQAMDVFALTSRSEGMPQAAIEACAARLPVVATRVGGLPELIDHGRTGLLVPAGDDAALARAIRFLFDDTTTRKLFGQRAHDRVVELFDVRRMAREYHEGFMRMLGAKGRATTDSRCQARGGIFDEVDVRLQ